MHRKHQQCAAGIQRSFDEFTFGVKFGQNFSRQTCYEIIDLIIVGTVAAPNAVALNIVEAKTLGTRDQRMQQTLGLADIFSCLQIM